MKIKDLMDQLAEIREIIAWNDIEDLDLTDYTRERIIIDLDNITEK